MKRILFVGVAALAACALSPAARAASPLSTNLVNTGGRAVGSAAEAPSATMSTLNPIISRIPLLEGPDQRHICIASDQVNRGWCVYVAIP